MALLNLTVSTYSKCSCSLYIFIINLVCRLVEWLLGVINDKLEYIPELIVSHVQ